MAHHSYECHQSFEFNLTRRAFTPSFVSENQINFNIIFEFKSSHYARNQNNSTSLEFMGQHGPFIINTVASVSFQQSLSYEEICDAIEEALTPLLLSQNGRQEVIKLAWNEACETVEITEPSCGYFVADLDFQLFVHHQYIFGLQNVEKSPGESSKKHETDYGNTSKSCCSICLEDLSDEGRAKMRLPCAHVFHDDCIKRWLRISHRCPLCRSEIPTRT